MNLAFIAAFQSWLQRNLLLVLFAGSALGSLGLVAWAYYAGRASQVQRDVPAPLRPGQVRALQQAAKLLAAQQARNQHQADSAYAKTQAPERDAARRQALIQHLTIRYHALAQDTAISAAAAADYLRHYRPGPDSL